MKAWLIAPCRIFEHYEPMVNPTILIFNRSVLGNIRLHDEALVSKFRPNLSNRLKDITEKQIPAKVETDSKYLSLLLDATPYTATYFTVHHLKISSQVGYPKLSGNADARVLAVS